MMNKQEVKKIEDKARKIMIMDNQIWEKFGWRSGGDVNQRIHKRELKKRVKTKLPILYYYIFEDANYHSLNGTLEDIGLFKGKYGTPQAERQWIEYSKSGGKTWQL